MNEQYDMRQMLLEIKSDEKVYRSKPVLLTQKEIDAMREKLCQVKKEGGTAI